MKLSFLKIETMNQSSLLGFSITSWLCLMFLVVIRLWLVSGQNVFAIGGNVHDDMLFLNLANSLLEGNWLGQYNQITLIKGPIYPLWISLVYLLGIPLLFAQHLLYLLSCFVFCISIKPLIRSTPVLISIFTLMLFNPMSYVDGPMTRILREGIYPALALFVVASVIGILIRHSWSIKALIPWSIGLAISVSAFWLIREDSIWLIPGVVAILCFSLWTILKDGEKDWPRVIVCLFPFMFLFISIGTVSTINKNYYGTFSVVDIKTPEFLAAYGALTRVKQGTWQPVVPVTREVREKIYAVSPAFSELKPYFVADIGGWGSTVKNIREGMKLNPELDRSMKAVFQRDGSGFWEETFNDDQQELLGAVFIWTFRYAAAAAGYHTSGDVAGEYYLRLAREINLACDEGQLDCYRERTSLVPPLNLGYAVPLFKTVINSLVYLARFDEFKASVSASSGSVESLNIYRNLTREPISALDNQSIKNGRSSLDNIKLTVMTSIAKIYQLSMPVIFIFAGVVYLITTIQTFKSRMINSLWVITSIILMSIFVRAGELAMVHITSFPTINLIYLSPSYPLLLIFSALSLFHWYQRQSL